MGIMREPMINHCFLVEPARLGTAVLVSPRCPTAVPARKLYWIPVKQWPCCAICWAGLGKVDSVHPFHNFSLGTSWWQIVMIDDDCGLPTCMLVTPWHRQAIVALRKRNLGPSTCGLQRRTNGSICKWGRTLGSPNYWLVESGVPSAWVRS